MPIVHSTAVVEETERFDYWHEWTCKTYSITDCERRPASCFSAQSSSWKFGSLELSNTSLSCGSDLRYLRGTREIRRDSRDDYLFLLVLRGHARVAQGDRSTLVQPGDMTMYHQGRPFTLDFHGDSQMILLKAPESTMLGRLPEAFKFTAWRLPAKSTLGALTGTVLRQLVQLDDTVEETVLARLGSSTMDILAAALEGEFLGPHRRGAGSAPLHRVKKYMMANLDDGALDIETITKAQSIAPRTLNRLFVAEGSTPMRWLWQQRLEASYKGLADGRFKRVTDAALSVGFNDLSHFSRSFKKAFGRLPHSLRRG